METTLPPNEVWSQVFHYLSKSDLKAIRLLGNAHLGSIASSLLFTTAYVAARKGVLDTFVALTTHPELCNYAKELVYDTSCFDHEMFTHDAETPHNRAVTQLYREQQVILQGEIQTSFRKAFTCLTNVQRVRVADLSRISYLPGDANSPAWNGDYLDGPLIRRSESISPGDAQEMDPINFYEAFVTLIQSLSETATDTLRHLSLGIGVHAAGGGGIPNTFFTEATAKDMHAYLVPIFRCLVTLEIAISCHYEPDSDGQDVPEQDEDESPDRTGFASLLRSAQQLEELTLTCVQKGHRIPQPDNDKSIRCMRNLRVSDTIAGHTWDKLRSVNIRNFEGTAQEVEDFITRHGKTLHSILIDDFNLIEGRWIPLIKSIVKAAPHTQCIFGLVYKGKRLYPIDELLPLKSKFFDSTGLKIKENIRSTTHPSDDGDENAEPNDGNLAQITDSESDSDHESSYDSDYLSISSDDSAPSTTSSPRRKPDRDLLAAMEPSLREKLSQLQEKLPGCPADHCQNMLGRAKGNVEVARRSIFREFGYTDWECTSPDLRDKISRLINEMAFDIEWNECIDALEDAKGDYNTALSTLKTMYGYRQNIFVDGEPCMDDGNDDNGGILDIIVFSRPLE